MIWLKIRVALSAAVEAMFIYICVIKSSKKKKKKELLLKHIKGEYNFL